MTRAPAPGRTIHPSVDSIIQPLVNSIIRPLTDFLFPPACLLCGGAVPEDELLCRECRGTVVEAAFGYVSPPRKIDHADSVFILLPYDDGCRRLIHALKYQGMPSVGLFLGELIGRKMTARVALPEDALVVPVPLHPSKLRERGYNQSERLARGFASFTGHTVSEECIARARKTPTQTALDENARRLNVRGAFRYVGGKALEGRPVVLIDDVLTTGSTVSECARALKSGGAGTVTVCVAATPAPGDD